jgi:hypothetical protein
LALLLKLDRDLRLWGEEPSEAASTRAAGWLAKAMTCSRQGRRAAIVSNGVVVAWCSSSDSGNPIGAWIRGQVMVE